MASTVSQTLANLSGRGTVTHSGSGSAVLTVASNADSTFAGVIANGSGTVALTKTGAETLTLSGTNTYTGATTVSDGILKIASTGSVDSSVTVNAADATHTPGLVLHGEIDGDLMVNGRFLLDFSDSRVLEGNVTGTVMFGEDALLEMLSEVFTMDDSYTLNATSSIDYGSRSFAELYADSVAAGTLQDYWAFSVTDNSITLSIDPAKVPEPASWLLLLGGLGFLFYRKWRR